MKRFLQTLRNSRGIADMELIVIAVVVAGIVTAGYFAYGSYNKTHAGSNTKLGSGIVAGATYTTTACKTYVGQLGGVDRVTVVFTKPTSAANSSYSVADYRDGNLVNSQSGSDYINGTSAQLTVNVATSQGDTLKIYAPGQTYQYDAGQISKFNNC